VLAATVPACSTAAPPMGTTGVEPFAVSQVQHPWVVPAATPIVPTLGTENRPRSNFGPAGWSHQNGSRLPYEESNGHPAYPEYNYQPGSAVCVPPPWTHQPGCPWGEPLD